MARVVISRQQNLALANRDLDGANWTPVNVTRIGNLPDPMGGTDATEISETVAVAGHSIFNSGSLITVPGNRQGIWICASAYFAPGTRGFAGFELDGAPHFAMTAFWNLNTGANTRFTNAGTGDPERGNATVLETLPGGWRRYQAAFYTRSTPLLLFLRVSMSIDGTTVGYAGNAAMNVLCFAPGLSFANWAGEITDTTAATIPGPIRNLAALVH